MSISATRLILAFALSVAAPLASAAGECAIDVTADDALRFSTKEIVVPPSCTQFTVNLAHIGKMPAASMGHNIVIAQTSDLAAVAKDGAAVQPDHVKEGDARVIAHTKIIGGGEKTSVTFDTAALQAGGDYSFFCSFPGHWAVMKGKVVKG